MLVLTVSIHINVRLCLQGPLPGKIALSVMHNRQIAHLYMQRVANFGNKDLVSQSIFKLHITKPLLSTSRRHK